MLAFRGSRRRRCRRLRRADELGKSINKIGRRGAELLSELYGSQAAGDSDNPQAAGDPQQTVTHTSSSSRTHSSSPQPAAADAPGSPPTCPRPSSPGSPARSGSTPSIAAPTPASSTPSSRRAADTRSALQSELAGLVRVIGYPTTTLIAIARRSATGSRPSGRRRRPSARRTCHQLRAACPCRTPGSPVRSGRRRRMSQYAFR